MKKLLLILTIFVSLQLTAQHTISGTFSPAKDYKWLLAYHLKPGTQNFIAETAVKNGVFNISIPENALPGTYRLVYAVPQEQFYFDVIYNGKEDITLAFDATSGVSFFTSKENILFNTYFKEITDLEQRITDYYTSGNADKAAFKNLTEQMEHIQDSYEKKSAGTMANHFIRSNTPYIPKEIQSVNAYVEGRKAHYFDMMEFDDPVLQASGFLTDKLLNYVFTALPLQTMTDREMQEAMNTNVDTINEKLAAVGDPYKMHLFYSLWTQAASSGYNSTSDYIYNNYLKKLASATDNKNIVDEIEVHNRLRMGAVAPDIKWKIDQKTFALNSLEGAEHYILVFWSSTCGHCLKELPALHHKLKDVSTAKVVAVGLEEDDVNWKRESAKLPNFEHAIALGKWESKYAKTYNILKTPSYFILDKEKRIIAKPENDKEVVEFLERK
ncbi:MAG: TlpA disulfide reductase family protein [Maribacter sp.]|uniref:TlpA family protein disulfide reductase n=1 Tax=Maribacter sp. TaxID=1897614 RepID=UPI003C79335F